MPKPPKKRTYKYWTKEEIMKEAKRFTKRGDFYTNSSNAYSAAYNCGLLEEVCAHMQSSRKKNKFVTPYPNHSVVLGRAFEFDNVPDFRNKYESTCQAGIRWGIDWQEFYENLDNASYIRRLITILAQNAAIGKLNMARSMAGDINRGHADRTRINVEIEND